MISDAGLERRRREARVATISTIQVAVVSLGMIIIFDTSPWIKALALLSMLGGVLAVFYYVFVNASKCRMFFKRHPRLMKETTNWFGTFHMAVIMFYIGTLAVHIIKTIH